MVLVLQLKELGHFFAMKDTDGSKTVKSWRRTLTLNHRCACRTM